VVPVENVFEDLSAVLMAIAGQSSAYAEDVLKGSCRGLNLLLATRLQGLQQKSFDKTYYL
jgi:hypothetical protein